MALLRVLFFSFALFVSLSAVNSLDSSEVKALVALQTAWQPRGWNGSPSCGWSGIFCTPDGHVFSMSFRTSCRSKPFSAGIPTEIGGLSYLSSLQLSCCNLTGPVPDSFGNLIKIVELSLGFNHLTSLPESICNLKVYIGDSPWGIWTPNDLACPVPSCVAPWIRCNGNTSTQSSKKDCP